MIPSLDLMVIVLAFSVPLLFLIMFLPSLLELHKPKDTGPRLIMEDLPEFIVRRSIAGKIQDIEEGQKVECYVISQFANVIEALPSLEV